MAKKERVPRAARRDGLCPQCGACSRWDGRECCLPSGPRLRCTEDGRECRDFRGGEGDGR